MTIKHKQPHSEPSANYDDIFFVGHQNSKITMDIYAKVKYNRLRELAAVVNSAFKQTSSND